MWRTVHFVVVAPIGQPITYVLYSIVFPFPIFYYFLLIRAIGYDVFVYV